MRDCPSQRVYIVIEDGGYMSASDVEDKILHNDNLALGNDDEEEILGKDDTTKYRTIIVQRVLSAQMEQAE